MRKTALVTGAGTGIGKKVAMVLADNGYDLGIHYLSSAAGANEVYGYVLSKGANAVILQGDIAKSDDRKRIFDCFFEKFDHIDLLVNNAGATGSAPLKPVLEETEDHFDWVADTNIKGTYFCMQRALQDMAAKGIKGVVVNITSVHQVGCFNESSVYAATKAAIVKFTMNAAMEMAKYGIRVVSVAPGYTLIEKLVGPEEAVCEKLPLKRWVMPEEIGAAVVFLASDGAKSITGTSLMIDGGLLLPVYTDLSALE